MRKAVRISKIEEIANKQEWGAILKEIGELCDLHGDAICKFERCREFANRLSIFLVRLEDMKCYRIADRVMDALGCCSPRIASHCENARVVKGLLERIKDTVERKLGECQ